GLVRHVCVTGDENLAIRFIGLSRKAEEPSSTRRVASLITRDTMRGQTKRDSFGKRKSASRRAIGTPFIGMAGPRVEAVCRDALPGLRFPDRHLGGRKPSVSGPALSRIGCFEGFRCTDERLEADFLGERNR